MATILHDSDCAVHNEPALPKAHCNCGAEWQSGDTAPKNGKPIWAWLYDGGIHLVRWVTAAENAENDGSNNPGDYISCWVKVADKDDGEWSVKFWLPWDAITIPPNVGMFPGENRWRDDAPPLRLDQ